MTAQAIGRIRIFVVYVRCLRVYRAVTRIVTKVEFEAGESVHTNGHNGADEEVSRIVPTAISLATGGAVIGTALAGGFGALGGAVLGAIAGIAAGHRFGQTESGSRSKN